MPDYKIENEYRDRGYKNICGVDEAGRGPLCGPVFAAACILPDGLVIEGLNDSKKLTEKKEKFFLMLFAAMLWRIALLPPLLRKSTR